MKSGAASTDSLRNVALLGDGTPPLSNGVEVSLFSPNSARKRFNVFAQHTRAAMDRTFMPQDLATAHPFTGGAFLSACIARNR